MNPSGRAGVTNYDVRKSVGIWKQQEDDERTFLHQDEREFVVFELLSRRKSEWCIKREL